MRITTHLKYRGRRVSPQQLERELKRDIEKAAKDELRKAARKAGVRLKFK